MLPVSPFAEGEILNWYLANVPGMEASIADPLSKPDLDSFFEARQLYRDTFDAVTKKHNLDAVVFPQAIAPLPDLDSDENIHETTVTAINIGGLPAVTVPAGQYENGGSPFGLIFVGRPFSEAELLALAYDYEQATQHRIVPKLEGK
jgi:Asp-tRNA(Asn)/Glu-tRNA(Gln) amidotransferase A subunit family amidase